jgi:predicted RNA-binding Zn-ribbon protein involved in translation (DUF1610 family)
MGLFDKKKPQQGQSQKQVTGRVNAVRCPHCGHSNDFRGLQAEMLLEKGGEYSCDKCRRYMLCTNVEQVVLVSVIQHPTQTGQAPVNPGGKRW